MLRPLAGPAGALRATRVESGRETPGRTRPPSIRGPPAPRVDPRGRRRRASRVHGGGRAGRRGGLRDAETTDQEDPGRTRGAPPGGGRAAIRLAETKVTSRLPRPLVRLGQVMP